MWLATDDKKILTGNSFPAWYSGADFFRSVSLTRSFVTQRKWQTTSKNIEIDIISKSK